MILSTLKQRHVAQDRIKRLRYTSLNSSGYSGWDLHDTEAFRDKFSILERIVKLFTSQSLHVREHLLLSQLSTWFEFVF